MVFIDHQGRQKLQRLRAGARLATHRGYIEHTDVIGLPPGSVLHTTQGKRIYAFRPSLTDYTMTMARKSGIVYPKDTAYILFHADIFPGARVVQGGVGSGALLLALARHVGPQGLVVGYDIRQDMLDHAAKNLAAWAGDTPQVQLRLANIYEGIAERDLDAVVLDVPEPWEAVGTLAEALKPGGFAVAYIPSIRQAEHFTVALRASRAFTLVETVEILVRDWYIWNRAVRPNHRMVGHTGFLTIGRRVVGLPADEEQAEPDRAVEPENI